MTDNKILDLDAACLGVSKLSNTTLPPELICIYLTKYFKSRGVHVTMCVLGGRGGRGQGMNGEGKREEWKGKREGGQGTTSI